jgi:serine/threonine-protein kinase HipA
VSKRAPDELQLWYIADPKQPLHVGTLRLVNQGRSVSLQYAAAWLDRGFAISEDLPLRDAEYVPQSRDEVVGAVEDARPDRWGERVIQYLEKPARLSLMEFLYFAGDERFGALSVSASTARYEPHNASALPALGDVGRIHELVRRMLQNEPIPAEQKPLLGPGTTMGGARPKALIRIQDEQWIVKFAELGDPLDSGLVEHAAMTLADKAGIRVAPTRAIRLTDGHAVAVHRFDRNGTIRRHAQSAYVALRAEGSGHGYPELAQLLRRRAPAEAAPPQMRELFRRMVFNILLDNTDDHEKNHALLMDDRQHLHLAPAFDVLPTAQGLGYQQMRVGAEGPDSTLENALSEARLFGLNAGDARAEAADVARTCAQWKKHFKAAGVSPNDIDYLAQFIDREFLREQRDEFAATPLRAPGAASARKQSSERSTGRAGVATGGAKRKP